MLQHTPLSVGAEPSSAVILPLQVAEMGVTTSTTEVTITASVPPLSSLWQEARIKINNNVHDVGIEKLIFMFYWDK